MKKNKLLIMGILVVAALVGTFFISSNAHRTSHLTPRTSHLTYYTCGMHPDVHVSPEEYNKGNTTCPICSMNLTPVYKKEFTSHASYYGCGMEGEEHVYLMIDAEGQTCPICGMSLKKLTEEEADQLRGVAGRVKIKGKEASRAGITTEPARKLILSKKIRTVGKVAYDPELAIAQEEFISSLKTLEEVQKGDIEEIKQRTLNLVESGRRKLKLLGLSDEQIKELEEQKGIQTNLLLPEEKMWIYGDIYEYELSWLSAGDKVKVTTQSLPGEEFYGTISSINPVVNPQTRSVTFRAEVDNLALKLMPEMYVDVVIMNIFVSSEGEQMVLAVPKDAVLDTGKRKIVWVEVSSGEYEGRIVEIGPEATSVVEGAERQFYPALKGLREGERVVTKANFLIDSQSQITGSAAGAYGGALGSEESSGGAPAGHQH